MGACRYRKIFFYKKALKRTLRRGCMGLGRVLSCRSIVSESKLGILLCCYETFLVGIFYGTVVTNNSLHAVMRSICCSLPEAYDDVKT